MVPSNSVFTVFLCALLFSVKTASGISQRFTASPKHASLKRTTTKFEPSYDFQKLVYYNEPEEQQNSDIELAASILLEPKYPLLIHEDLDYAIRRIQCVGDEISVSFDGYDYMQLARETWSAEEEFVIVTHTQPCADPGEHAAYLVHLDSARYTGYRLQLRGRKTTLKAVTHRMFVDMGAHVMPQVDKGKWKRLEQSITEVSTVVVLTTVDAGDSSSTLAQQSSVETTTVATSSPASTPENSPNGATATASLPSDASESFAFSSPTASPTGGSDSSDISFSEIGLSLMPPDQAITDTGVSYPTIDNVLVKCLNCSGTGQVSFSSAGFTMSGDDIENARNFLDNGYIEFDAAGLSAHMFLQLQLQPGFSVLSFENNLRRKQLGSIQIANVIVIEPFLDFGVPIDITLQSPITIEAGFTFNNPDTGKIVLNMSELSSSYSSGFEHSSFNALPFDADVPDLSFEFSIAFKPKMSVNIGLTDSAKNDTDGEFDIDGGFGVYVEIPNLKVDISEMHNVDADCQPSSDQNIAIEVAPGIEWTAGYTAEVDVSGLIDYKTDDAGVFFSTALGFGKFCMIWDANILGYVNPSATSSLASASGTAAVTASLASVSASNALASASSALVTAAGGPGSASAASAVASASSAVAAASSASASVAHHNAASKPQMAQTWPVLSLLSLLLGCFFSA